jgi:hypothetical protein
MDFRRLQAGGVFRYALKLFGFHTFRASGQDFFYSNFTFQRRHSAAVCQAQS